MNERQLVETACTFALAAAHRANLVHHRLSLILVGSKYVGKHNRANASLARRAGRKLLERVAQQSGVSGFDQTLLDSVITEVLADVKNGLGLGGGTEPKTPEPWGGWKLGVQINLGDARAWHSVFTAVDPRLWPAADGMMKQSPSVQEALSAVANGAQAFSKLLLYSDDIKRELSRVDEWLFHKWRVLTGKQSQYERMFPKGRKDDAKLEDFIVWCSKDAECRHKAEASGQLRQLADQVRKWLETVLIDDQREHALRTWVNEINNHLEKKLEIEDLNFTPGFELRSVLPQPSFVDTAPQSKSAFSTTKKSYAGVGLFSGSVVESFVFRLGGTRTKFRKSGGERPSGRTNDLPQDLSSPDGPSLQEIARVAEFNEATQSPPHSVDPNCWRAVIAYKLDGKPTRQGIIDDFQISAQEFSRILGVAEDTLRRLARKHLEADTRTFAEQR